MVSAHTGGGRVTRTKPELRKWHEIRFRRTTCCDGGGAVRARERLQVPGQRSHVAGLQGHRRRQLVLNGEIATHRVRSVVIKLNPAQCQTAGVDQERAQWRTRKSRLKSGVPNRLTTCRRAPRKRSSCTDGGNVIRRRVVEIKLEGIVLAQVR